MVRFTNYWVFIRMLTESNAKFVNVIEKIVKETMQRAEAELSKAKDYKEILDLPSKKENWEAQDGAEKKMMEHLKKVLVLMGEMSILTEGVNVFKDGLRYRELKEKGVVKIVRID